MRRPARADRPEQRAVVITTCGVTTAPAASSLAHRISGQRKARKRFRAYWGGGTFDPLGAVTFASISARASDQHSTEEQLFGRHGQARRCRGDRHDAVRRTSMVGASVLAGVLMLSSPAVAAGQGPGGEGNGSGSGGSGGGSDTSLAGSASSPSVMPASTARWAGSRSTSPRWAPPRGDKATEAAAACWSARFATRCVSHGDPFGLARYRACISSDSGGELTALAGRRWSPARAGCAARHRAAPASAVREVAEPRPM